MTRKGKIPTYPPLNTTHPRLASQLVDQSLGKVLTQGSGRKVSWKCEKCGYVWAATTANRVSRNSGCPVCAGKLAVAGVNDLSTTHPELQKELIDKEIPRLAGSHQRVHWECSVCHYSWEAPVRSRALRGRGCPLCANQVVIEGVNDLKTTHPDLYAEQVDKGQIVVAGSKKILQWECKNGHIWDSTVKDRKRGAGCPQCWMHSHRSRSEIELSEFIRSVYDGEVVTSALGILKDRQELDIYIPDKSIAVEFNGLYWHSEDHVPKNKHFDKYKECSDIGIRLIQVWEDEWEHRRSVVESFIESLLNGRDAIGARTTYVTQINKTTADEFLETHHLRGTTPVGKYLGLRNRETDELVAVVSLRSTDTEISVDRYASSITVIGGLLKLLHANGSGVYTTFSDNCVSDGQLYLTTGWTKIKDIPPEYMYTRGMSRFHKFSYRLDRFREDKSLIYREGLSESELASLNKLKRIWDAGKVKYSLTIK